MKTLAVKLMALVITMLVTLVSYANDEKFIGAMKKNIDALYQAKDAAALQAAINAFERIASVEKTRWEPLYYAAYGNIMLALGEQEATKKDVLLDLALASVNKAKGILPNDSELAALEGFVYMVRVTVDPSSRGPQYGGLSMQLFGKASALNPENPRALALMAQMQFGTAQFFNQPTTDACNTLAQAMQKFETFKSDNPLAPQWGKAWAESLKEQCK